MTVLAGGCVMGGFAPEPCAKLDSATVALLAPGSSGSGIYCPEAQPAPGTPEPAYRDDIFFDEGSSSCGASPVDGYFGIYYAPIEPYLPSEYTIGPEVMCGLSYSSGSASSCTSSGDIPSGDIAVPLAGTPCTNTFRWFGARMFATNRPQVSREVDGSDVVQRINLFPNSRRVLTYKRAVGSGAGDSFVGTNGTTSVGEMYDADPGSAVHYVYKIRDRRGYVSWYFAKDPATVTRGTETVTPYISGQLWKIAYDTGNSDETTWPTMYVGEDKPGTTGWNTLANAYRGFEVCTGSSTTILQPRVKTMYDSAGRKFTYTYSGDSVSSVKKEYWTGSAWAISSEATFDYYESGDSNGPEGMLRLVQTTETMSDSAVKQYRYQYFRYDSGGLMTLQMASEGIRQAVLDPTTSGVSYTSLANVRDFLKNRSLTLLKPYSSAIVEYSSGKVSTIIGNGMCGCTGGGPSGQYTYTYQVPSDYSSSSNGVSDSDGDYDCSGAWFSAAQSKSSRRTKIQNPDGTYDVTYYDDTAQVLGTVKCAVDPDGGSHNTSAQTIWATLYERDADTRIVKIYSPEMVTSYSHSTGKFTVYSGTTPPGTMTEYVYSTDTFLTGKVVTEVRVNTKTSATATAPVSVTTYETSGSDWYMDIGGANGVRMAKPIVKSSKVYKNEVISGYGTDETDYDTTSYAYTFWGSGSIPWAFKTVETTFPRSLTGENGSNSATTTKAYFDQKSGKTAFSQNANGRLDFYKYDSDTGRVLDTVTDVDASVTDAATAASGLVTLPTTSSAYFKLRTTYKYDSRGRLTSATNPAGRSSFNYYTRLGDHQAVVLSGPKLTGTSGSETYTGPVGYSVVNLAGRRTGQGTLTLSSSGSTNTSMAIAGWISTSATSPISAVGGEATLARFSESQYDLTGNRLKKSLLYTSWSGTPVTEDTEYRYDGMGRVVGVKDPTGTIRRSTFDALGRGLSQWIGTNDISAAGEKFSTSGTDNMTETSRVEYVTQTPLSGSYLLGTSRVSKQHQDADGVWTGTGSADDRRTVELIYDYRNRVVVQKAPLSPHSVTKYDFRGRAIASASYSSATGLSASTDPASTTSYANRLSLSETFYDGRGQVYKSTQHEITQSTGASASTLDTLMWYDADRKTIKTTGPGGLMKYAYDRLDRQIRSYSLASISDSAYADAATLTSDVVLEESLTAYESTTGNVLMSASFARHHDKDATISGPLDANADNDNFKITDTDLKQSGSVIARAQITAMWYDDFDRPTDTVQYGTYTLNDSGGSTAFTRTGLTVPARSDTALRTTTAYDKDGTVLTTTDPKNIASKTLYDKAGRRVATIANSTNASTPISTANRDTDQYVRYVYGDGSTSNSPKGLLVKMWVDFDGDNTEDTDDQVTQYKYGTTKGSPGSGTPPTSRIATGHLLREAFYPLKDSETDAQRTISTAYNALAEEVWTLDQIGTVLETSYDTAGRQSARTATTLGTNIDSSVRAVGMTYTNRGQVAKVTQYSNVGASTIYNEVAYTYDGWGNTTKFEEDADSAVGASGGIGTLAVDFGYQRVAPSNGRPSVRRTSVSYPDGWVLNQKFSSSGLDDVTGRVTSLTYTAPGQSETGDRVQYQYLGSERLVSTLYNEPSVASRLHDNASTPKYDRLDRFDRITMNEWRSPSSGALPIYDLRLKYDENSNITETQDLVLRDNGDNLAFSNKYTMDAINRVAAADRGILSSGSISGDTRWNETWDLSQTGNWTTNKVKRNSDGDYTDTGERNETRTHSRVNEVLTRSGQSPPVHDLAGQMTDDGRVYEYQYDAFGRMVGVYLRDSGSGFGGTAIAAYRYDGLGQRIAQRGNSQGISSADPWFHFVHDDRWRIIATYRGNAAHTAQDTNAKERFVWHAAGRDGMGSASYIDSMAWLDRNLSNAWRDSAADATLETRYYFCQNWRADTVALLGAIGSGWLPTREYRYSAYGRRIELDAADFNQDGFVDFFDLDEWDTAWLAAGPRADFNRDGFVDYFDDDAFYAIYTNGTNTGQPTGGESGGIRTLYAGYQLDPNTSGLGIGDELYHVRRRIYITDMGRWTRRDPIGYTGSLSLLLYVGDMPVKHVDPMGLDFVDPSRINPPSWYEPVKPSKPRDFEPPSLSNPVELPLLHEDPYVLLCSRGTNISYLSDLGAACVGAKHQWIKTRANECGLGTYGGGVPGQPNDEGGESSSAIPYLSETGWNDHLGQYYKPGSNCVRVYGCDLSCVNREITNKARQGPWALGTNDCNTKASGVLKRCGCVNVCLEWHVPSTPDGTSYDAPGNVDRNARHRGGKCLKWLF